MIDPRAVGVAGTCQEWSPGGVDVAIECSGQEPAIQAALAAVRPGGRVVQAGVPVRPPTLDLASLMLRGLTIVGSVGFPVRCWPELMDEVATGALPIDRVMTGRVTMENAVADGFERLLDADGDAIKILVDVGSGSGRHGCAPGISEQQLDGPAVDRPRRARDVGGLPGAQEHHDGCHLARVRELAAGHAASAWATTSAIAAPRAAAVCSRMPAHRVVSTGPGRIALTVTPREAYASAKPRDSASWAALVTA